jgi:lysozyme
MNISTRTLLRKLLLKHEGFRQFVYKDNRNIATVGIGRNLESKGVSLEEAFYLLDDDLIFFSDKLTTIFPWFAPLDENRKAALIDMTFNLGVNGFLEFHEMIAALDKHDFEKASQCLLASEYATQVGERARDLAQILLTGVVSL